MHFRYPFQFNCRLVQKGPDLSSRSCSPVEFYDPTRDTLIELLKNITEECGGPSQSPRPSLRAPSSSSENISPAATLSKQLADVLSARVAQTHCPEKSTSHESDSKQKDSKISSASKSPSTEGLNTKSELTVPIIQITRTGSEKKKSRSGSKESLNDICIDAGGQTAENGI